MRKLQYVGKGKKRVSMAVMAAMLIVGMTACGSTAETNVEQSVQDTLEYVGTENAEASGEGITELSAAEQPEGMQVPDAMLQGDRYIGEITAIDGNTITVEAVSMGRNAGNMPEGEVPDGMPSGEKPTGEAPDGMANGEKPTGEAPDGMTAGEKPIGEATDGIANGEKPTGEASDGMANGEKPAGEAPDGMANGEIPAGEKQTGEAPDGMNFADMERETMTIEVTDDVTITIDGEEATLVDLQIGDSIMFTMDGDAVTEISVGTVETDMKERPQQETPMEAQKDAPKDAQKDAE